MIKSLLRMLGIAPTAELLALTVVGEYCVTVTRFRGVGLVDASFELDGRPVSLTGCEVVSGEDGEYKGCCLDAKQMGMDVIAVLACPNKPSPVEYCKTYPKGLPTLSMKIKGRTRSATGLASYNKAVLWPTFG